MKNKIKKILYFISNNNIVELFLLIFTIIFITAFFIGKEKIDIEIIDFTIFFSLIASIILQILGKLISNLILKWCEDDIKLDSNYERIVNKYPKLTKNKSNDLIIYKNENSSQENINVLKKVSKNSKKNIIEYRFPVIKDCDLSNMKISIIDSPKMYKIPTQIEERFSELLRAHSASNIYNQLNIRVYDWKIKNDIFKIYTERTTYFFSLVTNRSMDYKWNNGLTIREYFQYGPFAPKLKDSVLSNHLGFNGFIISSDNYIPFVKRSNSVSIGKSTYGNSIGASLKAKYSLNNENKIFTLNGLKKAIIQEIYDELKISCNENKISEKNIIFAYRDLVEGGKPNLLFFYKSDDEYRSINENFYKEIKKVKKSRPKWDKEAKELEDGSKLLWIHIDELKKAVITPSMIIFSGKIMKMMPSASASVILFLDWLKKQNDWR